MEMVQVNSFLGLPTLYNLYPGNVARYIYIRFALFAFKYSLLIYWRVRLGRMDATTTGQRYHIPHRYASKKIIKNEKSFRNAGELITKQRVRDHRVHRASRSAAQRERVLGHRKG